jgi:hypothetical protein
MPRSVAASAVFAWRYLRRVTYETAGLPVTAAVAAAEYVVVLRARSAARFLPEEGWELLLDAVPGLGLGPVRIRAATRWVAVGGHTLPRELIVEVRGHATSLDEAVAKFGTVARPIATMAGFVANVRIEELDVHLAYDSTPGKTERAFAEVFLPDEQGGVTDGRFIRQHLLGAAATAFLQLETDSARVSRGLRQYELALREWCLGGEWLALSHLYMAVEALTKAVIRKTAAGRGITEEELAQAFGVVTDDPDQPRWRPVFEAKIREQLIFGGDRETYQAAKAASDGLEHGFLGLDAIAAHALKCADKTFHHVRQTIIGLLGLPGETTAELMAIKPKDVQSRRKIARGQLFGSVEGPAAEGELYPLLEWSSSIESVIREGSRFEFRTNDKFTVRTHPGVSFRMERLEVFGRLEDGQAPVEASTLDALIGPAAGLKSSEMLAAVMPLIEAATASGTDTGQSLPRVLAFNLFSQGVAFYESICTLIGDQRPVEALPALGGLVIIAARFEQIATAGGAGVGVAMRLALDTPADLGASPDVAAMYCEHLITSAAAAGITIPEHVAEPETSTIYTSLATEMLLARSAANGKYAAIWPHIQHQDTEHIGFHTRLEPGPYADMIASASVIAQLELLKHAATLFEWTIEQDTIANLLDEARALNEASADSASGGN